MNPLISIIIPCYNQATYLPDALQSLLDQEYSNWECIIVNDGSSDNTEKVALQWVNKDNRIKYFNKANTGVCDTRNFGVQQAAGEYLLPLDGDDKISQTYINEAIDVFKREPQTKLVYSNILLFGEKDQGLVMPDFDYEKMLTENMIPVSAIFRRADFLKTQGYNSNMVNGLEDWDFWLSFLNKEDAVVKLNAYHLYYRIKAVSRSASINTHKQKNDAMLLQMFKNHVPLFLEYFNPIRDRIEAEYYKKESNSLQNSVEYKLGRLIYSPVKLSKRIFRKLFS